MKPIIFGELQRVLLVCSWIIENARKDDFPDFTINLLILSEKEFLSEYEAQEELQDLIETAVVVYKG